MYRFIVKTVAAIFSLAALLMSTSIDCYAYKLELQDTCILIDGVGGQYSLHQKFTAKGNSQLPDSLPIDEIQLVYSGEKTKTEFSIQEKDGEYKWSDSIKGSNSQREMSKLSPLILLTNKNYLITHGNMTWELTFVDTTSPTEPTPPVEEPIDAEEKASFPWWLALLLGLVGGAILGAGSMLLLRYLAQKSKKGKKKQGTPAPSDGPNEGKSEEATIEEPSTKDQIEADLLNQLLPGEELASMKKDLISKKLADLSKIKESFDKICDALGLAVSSPVDMLLQKINLLTQPQPEPETKPVEPAPQKSDCEEIIRKIERKESKELKELLSKAQYQVQTSSPVDILMKMVDLLPSELRRQSANSQSNQPSVEITDAQLNSPENRRTLKLWMIGKLEDAGFTGFSRNNLVMFEDYLKELAEKINSPKPVRPEPERRIPDNVIVSRAIKEDKLSDDDKKILISKLIAKLNEHIEHDDLKVDANLSADDYLRLVAERLQMPNSFDEAQTQERMNNLAVVNKLLGCDLEEFGSEELKTALDQTILQLLKKKFNISAANSLDDIIDKWNQNASLNDQALNLLDKYKVEKLKEVPSAVLNSQFEDIKKPIESRLQELLPDVPVETLQKLVNQLLTKAEAFKADYESVTDELQESMASRDSQFISSNQSAKEILPMYFKSVKDKEIDLQSQIESKGREISQLNESLTSKDKEIVDLENEKKTLMAESRNLIDGLHQSAARVQQAWRTILRPCADMYEAQCADIEDRLFTQLKDLVGRLQAFNCSDTARPAEVKKDIQNLLAEEIVKDNSIVNTICRYYAYSRLPFMTDTSREHGVTFNRRNMAEIFKAVSDLYAQYGINLDIPALFVMGIDEGDYENLTGKTYGDLDNLCQNSRNHFDNIDTNVKPANVIVDIVNIGYSIDGNHMRKASVLTY